LIAVTECTFSAQVFGEWRFAGANGAWQKDAKAKNAPFVFLCVFARRVFFAACWIFPAESK
jgi:hypothetical protein